MTLFVKPSVKSSDPVRPIALFVLPCAGASATMFLRWRRDLPPWIRLNPIELPGRGTRINEAFVDDFDRLVAQLCAEQADALQGHYALFGHSLGAWLAWGMAQHLRTLGARLPAHLFVSASPAPSMRDTDYFEGKDSDEALVEELRRQGGTPEEVLHSAELRRMSLDTLAADYRVGASFRHGHVDPLPIPLHALAGRDDDISAEQVRGWEAEATGLFTAEWFDGGHFFIREQQRQVLETVVRKLSLFRQKEAGHATTCTA